MSVYKRKEKKDYGKIIKDYVSMWPSFCAIYTLFDDVPDLVTCYEAMPRPASLQTRARRLALLLVNQQDGFITEQLFRDPGDFQMMFEIGLHLLELEPSRWLLPTLREARDRQVC